MISRIVCMFAGKVTLFVVNHGRILARDTVEKFEFIPGQMALKHIHTYSNEIFRV